MQQASSALPMQHDTTSPTWCKVKSATHLKWHNLANMLPQQLVLLHAGTQGLHQLSGSLSEVLAEPWVLCNHARDHSTWLLSCWLWAGQTELGGSTGCCFEITHPTQRPERSLVWSGACWSCAELDKVLNVL